VARSSQGDALQLLVIGALMAVLSRLTGESEAERLWDAMSATAQQLLWSDTGSGRFLSHAILGTYLSYAFVVVASWRALQEVSRFVGRTRPFYLVAVLIVTGDCSIKAKQVQRFTILRSVWHASLVTCRTSGNSPTAISCRHFHRALIKLSHGNYFVGTTTFRRIRG
jgi:hypothetical protein